MNPSNPHSPESISYRASQYRLAVHERDRLAAQAATAGASRDVMRAAAAAARDVRSQFARIQAMGDPAPAVTPLPSIPAAEAAVKVTAPVAPVAPVARSGAVNPIVQEDPAEAAQRLADEIIASARLASA